MDANSVKMIIFIIAAILLYGTLTGTCWIVVISRKHRKHCAYFPYIHCCTAAQNDHIRNFQEASRNSTHITFSWDIVDGYYNSSDVRYFYLYYQHRTSTPSLYISYRSVTSNGATFSYSSSLGNFNNGPYIMWVRVYRRSALYPRNTYSEKVYVKIGKYV